MALPNLGLTSITVTRYTADGEYVNGTWLSAGSSALVVQASVQPITGRELLHLPEGWRTREPIRIYTNDALYTVDEAAKREADVVTYNGRTYEVKQAIPWEIGRLAHHKAIAIKIDETE